MVTVRTQHIPAKLLLVCCALALIPGWAIAATCRLALVLALDVSGSVNEAEYAQQLNGVAFALGSPAVRASILESAETHVDLAVFEWSSQNHQFVIQPWTTLNSNAAIDRAVARIQGFQRRRAGLKTALSTALIFAANQLQEKSHCWQRKIDVSGDGKNNIGPDVADIYRSPSFSGVTVNALVVTDPSAPDPTREIAVKKDDLRRYYEREVIFGPGAFAMIAYGYDDYARAMEQKLLREIELPVLGALPETLRARRMAPVTGHNEKMVR